MKLTVGVNFTNILGAAFTCSNPKCVQKDSQVFFELLGPLSAKAAHKMLLILALDVRIITVNEYSPLHQKKLP